MSTAIFPGSFDPVTIGHLDLVTRAAHVFDEVIVAVGVNPGKRGWLTVEQRVDLLAQAIAEENPHANIRVISFEGLLVDAAKEAGADVIVKGVRTARDFDSEYAQAAANRDLSGIETMLLPSSPQWQYISSTLVREIHASGGSIRRYVPPAVNQWVTESGMTL